MDWLIEGVAPPLGLAVKSTVILFSLNHFQMTMLHFIFRKNKKPR